MSTTPAPMPEAQASVSPFGRIVGVFFSPKPTFEDIGRKPSWILPVILSSVLGVAVGFALNQRVDWRDVASKRIEESPRASQLSAEQKEKQLDISAKISPIIAYCIGLIAPTLGALVVGGVMLGAFNLLGGANAGYKVSLGIVSHAYLPFLIHGLLFILILYLKPPGTVDLDNPVASNLGAFFPQGTAKWLVTFGSGVDIFNIWTTALIGVGFAAFNPRKLKTGGAIGIALAVLALWEAIRTGFSFIFS
jgi:hypothetical protein